MATIRDVAKLANVDVSTVSRALNNKENVNPDTRNRVIKAAEELNYQPNILARGLKERKTYTIALLAPPMIEMGIAPIAAHLFIFIFSCIGAITPPVAITAYTAAAIGDADPNQTGWTAFRLGIVAYIVPFIFITSPALILVGTGGEIALAAVTSIIGVLSLVAAFEGNLFAFRFNVIARICLAIAALLTLIPGAISDAAGVALIVVALVISVVSKKRMTVTSL